MGRARSGIMVLYGVSGTCTNVTTPKFFLYFLPSREEGGTHPSFGRDDCLFCFVFFISPWFVRL